MACPVWNHGLFELRSNSWWFNFDPYPNEYALVSLVGSKGNPSLLEIFSIFSRARKQMEVGEPGFWLIFKVLFLQLTSLLSGSELAALLSPLLGRNWLQKRAHK